MASAFDGPIPGNACSSVLFAALIFTAFDLIAVAWLLEAVALAADGEATVPENVTSGVIFARVAGPMPDTASRSERFLNGP